MAGTVDGSAELVVGEADNNKKRKKAAPEGTPTPPGTTDNQNNNNDDDKVKETDDALPPLKMPKVDNNDADDSEFLMYVDSPIGGQWGYMFGRLKKYKEQHGTTSVPKKDPDQQLFSWVKYQRYMFHHKDMAEERKVALNEIGFDWGRRVVKDNSRRETWEDKLERLIAFKERNGNCLVPHNYKADRSLGYWVSHQRNYYNKGQLSEEKIAKLNALGFEWKPHYGRPWHRKRNEDQENFNESATLENEWNVQYAKLKSFSEKNKHCNLPSDHDDPDLLQWANVQRLLYHSSLLPPDQVVQLELIGFPWHASEQTEWNEHFEQVRAIKDSSGGIDDPKLSRWINMQRLHYKRNALSKDRVDKLISIGFDLGCRPLDLKEQKLEILVESKKLQEDIEELRADNFALRQDKLQLRSEVDVLRKRNFRIGKEVKQQSTKDEKLISSATELSAAQAKWKTDMESLSQKAEKYGQTLKERAEKIKEQDEKIQKLLQQLGETDDSKK